MRRVNGRPFSSRLVGGDRGAAATLFAVLIATGVVMGMLALSVDVGNAMWERRQLQNGADATVMALARACANDPGAPECDPASVAGLLDANAADGLANYRTDRPDAPDGACGRGDQLLNESQLSECDSASTDADIADLLECPPLPGWLADDPQIPYVETYSQTLSDAQTIFPGAFSRILTGGASDGTKVTACARAAWGPASPNQSSTLPLTMSECDWSRQTGWTPEGEAVFPPGPGPRTSAYPYGYGSPDHPWPTSSGFAEQTIWSKGNPTECETSAPGGTAPGGFAWIEGDTGSCEVVVVDGKWVPSDPGFDGCPPEQFDSHLGTIVYIPVFDCKANEARTGPVPDTDPPFDCDPDSGGGSNIHYHVSGFAAFYLTGWKLGNVSTDIQPSIATTRSICGGTAPGYPEGGQACLFGWFLQGLIPEGEIDTTPDPTGTPNYGLNVVQPAG